MGVTLVELLVGMAILAIVLALGVPTFSMWMQNTQIRNAAESIQNGLQLARTEAVKRNTTVRFSMTTSVDNSCVLSSSAANWVISLGDPSGKCGGSLLNGPGDPAPQLIQVYSKSEGASRVVVDADQSQVTFNGMGQLTSSVTKICVGMTNVSAASCSVPGRERHLAIKVSAGGQVRMCDPRLASGDPQGC
jgi:type IV fimbrial biogenesis protein FimT